MFATSEINVLEKNQIEANILPIMFCCSASVGIAPSLRLRYTPFRINNNVSIGRVVSTSEGAVTMNKTKKIFICAWLSLFCLSPQKAVCRDQKKCSLVKMAMPICAGIATGLASYCGLCNVSHEHSNLSFLNNDAQRVHYARIGTSVITGLLVRALTKYLQSDKPFVIQGIDVHVELEGIKSELEQLGGAINRLNIPQSCNDFLKSDFLASTSLRSTGILLYTLEKQLDGLFDAIMQTVCENQQEAVRLLVADLEYVREEIRLKKAFLGYALLAEHVEKLERRGQSYVENQDLRGFGLEGFAHSKWVYDNGFERSRDTLMDYLNEVEQTRKLALKDADLFAQIAPEGFAIASESLEVLAHLAQEAVDSISRILLIDDIQHIAHKAHLCGGRLNQNSTYRDVVEWVDQEEIEGQSLKQLEALQLEIDRIVRIAPKGGDESVRKLCEQISHEIAFKTGCIELRQLRNERKAMQPLFLMEEKGLMQNIGAKEREVLNIVFDKLEEELQLFASRVEALADQDVFGGLKSEISLELELISADLVQCKNRSFLGDILVTAEEIVQEVEDIIEEFFGGHSVTEEEAREDVIAAEEGVVE